MSAPAFILGFSCCSIVVIIYLQYQVVEILRELLEIMKRELNDE